MRPTPIQYAHALRATVGDLAAFRAAITDLERVSAFVGIDPTFQAFFAHGEVPTDRKEELLHQAFRRPIGAEAFAVAHLLLDRRSIQELSAVVAAAARLADVEEGIARVRIESARAVPDAERTSVEHAIHEAVHRPIRATYTERPELVAGFRVTVDDSWEWDGTVAGRLQRLAAHIRTTSV
ncbi:F0F1 ATP synthase subunit delta [Candidatus Uhrbacteria bacterium]|nr:F0F1 ATP synthase subunit delta [Candidatus Uhrbacteria bacterium]